jgi:hypothetical protein
MVRTLSFCYLREFLRVLAFGPAVVGGVAIYLPPLHRKIITLLSLCIKD